MAMEVNGGQHCSVADCSQYDFLPFTCEACKNVFCLDHRAQKDHSCTEILPEQKNSIPQCPLCKQYIFIQNNESVDTKMSKHIDSGCTQYVIDMKAKPKSACAFDKCKNNRAPVQCPKCKKFYCAEHRLPMDHACPVPSPKKGGQFWNPFLKNKDKNESKISSDDDSSSKNNSKNKKRSKSKDKKKKKNNKKKKKIDPAKNRIRMKTDAIGNANIASEDRFYLEILFSSSIKKKQLAPLTMFFNKTKTVGRILDEICDQRNIKNKNHLPNARKLVIDCVRTESQLPFDMPLHLMEPEFMSGDTIFMRYEDEERE